MHIQKLLKEISSHYATHGRDLPWRHTRDPYKILVSEMMLQQTQVERVIGFYKKFLKEFPTARKLAEAPLSEVLVGWQGLGYNRRGKFLHQAAKIITKDGFGGKLPGVGPYTAAAIDAFAHNRLTVFIETNIRTVFIHFCFKDKKEIADAEILPLVEKALKAAVRQGTEPRDFYAALMDYGAYLKKSGVKLNARSKHYVKQSVFEGSKRQKRAAQLRQLLASGASDKELEKLLNS